jgi:heme-degrading monooxygenase HmoA
VILRSWRAQARSGDASRYRAHLLGHVVPALRALDGFRGVRLLQREVDGGVDIVVQTTWTSWEAIRAFAGDDPAVAVVEPAAQAVLTSFDRHVEHYEMLDDLGATS